MLGERSDFDGLVRRRAWQLRDEREAARVEQAALARVEREEAEARKLEEERAAERQQPVPKAKVASRRRRTVRSRQQEPDRALAARIRWAVSESKKAIAKADRVARRQRDDMAQLERERAEAVLFTGQLPPLRADSPDPTERAAYAILHAGRGK